MTNLPDVWVFDLDNTLAQCSEAYVVARNTFFDLVAERVRNANPTIDHKYVRERFEMVDSERYIHLKTSPERLPGSMAIVARKLHEEAGLTLPAELEQQVTWIGKSVFTFDYPPYPAAMHILRSLRKRGSRTAICTKGDESVQRAKIDRWKYPVDGVQICAQKTAKDILSAAKAAAPEGWRRLIMTGDTRRDDVAAGKEAGATTVWIKNPHLPDKGWAYDSNADEIQADITIDTLDHFLDATRHLMDERVPARARRV